MSRSSSSSRTRRRSAAFSASTGVCAVPGPGRDPDPDPSVGTAGSARTTAGPLRRPSASRIQFRNVSGFTPRSSATDRIVASGREWYNATASALNSAE